MYTYKGMLKVTIPPGLFLKNKWKKKRNSKNNKELKNSVKTKQKIKREKEC